MDLLLCPSWGNFVAATAGDGGPTPLRDACPRCAGTEFEDVGTGRVVETGD